MHPDVLAAVVVVVIGTLLGLRMVLAYMRVANLSKAAGTVLTHQVEDIKRLTLERFEKLEDNVLRITNRIGK